MAIIINRKPIVPEKHYPVTEVSMATGLSENTIYAYFTKRGISTRGGLTLDQIEEVCLSGRRGGIKWSTVREIVSRLKEEKGITIVYDDIGEGGEDLRYEQTRML